MSTMLADAVYHLKRPFHWLKTGIGQGLVAQITYNFPQRHLKIICITGTDGKTTSSTLLYHVLKTAGKKVGLVSTVAAYIGQQEIDTGFHVTAPSPKQLYSFMRRMVNEGYEYLILETTSHGIYQYRTWGITPLIAGLTNIAHEHLDYHVTYENYVEAKVSLLKTAKVAVINADDHSANKARRMLKTKKHNLLEYSKDERLPRVIAQSVAKRFPELFNQYNVRLVYKIANYLVIKPDDIAKAITTFPQLPGRMERIPNHLNLEIVVDFAHTPQGLEAALKTLKKQLPSKGKLIAVFGCASERDRAKRPMMTEIAVNLADSVILTAEDPRRENIWAIFREMKEQLTHGHQKLISIADRREAIEFAIKKVAKAGDILGIFGKGHEKSMNIGGIELPWSDQTAINEILKTTDKPHSRKSHLDKLEKTF